MDYTKIDFAAILGRTDKKGHWLEIEQKQELDETIDELPSDKTKEDNMYLFEGVDYRSAAQKTDIDLFNRLIVHDDHGTPIVTSSSEHRVSERPTRRPMTEEEKAARVAKTCETKARRKQEMVNDRSISFHSYSISGRS